MDMIPFGHIRVYYPLTRNKLKSTRGYERMDYFSYAQKKSFITQRAMAASPLFMGGTCQLRKLKPENLIFDIEIPFKFLHVWNHSFYCSINLI